MVIRYARDRFVMDVSHQGYVHKMFTGRSIDLAPCRQFGGLNGFLLRTESEHDAMARATQEPPCLQHSAWPSGATCEAVTRTSWSSRGDAAFTCGISYEALNNVKAHTKRFIVVLNDNEWSIAKNVGAIANYLNTSWPSLDRVSHLHEKSASFLSKQLLRNRSRVCALKLRRASKACSVPRCHFRGARLALLRPIDGHDISSAHPDI